MTTLRRMLGTDDPTPEERARNLAVNASREAEAMYFACAFLAGFGVAMLFFLGLCGM